jgi:PAS domain S-box-containing protein
MSGGLPDLSAAAPAGAVAATGLTRGGRRLWALHCAGFCLLLLALIATITLSRRSGEADAWVAHSLEVRHATSDLLDTMQDAETSVRGYLLTDNPDDLAGYETARRLLPSAMARLRALTMDSPVQQTRLDSLEPLIAGRLAALDRAIEVFRSGNQRALELSLRAGPGEALMRQIRGLIASMDQTEADLLAERRAAAIHSRNLLLAGGIAALLLALSLGVLTARLAQRESHILRTANEQLDQAVLERTRELHETARRLALVTDTARVGLMVIDRTLRLRYVNRPYAESVGKPERELIGARVADVHAAIYDAQIRPHLERALGGERVAFELTNPPLDPDGDEHHIAVTAEPATDAAGERIIVTVAVDISDRVRTAAALRDSEARFRGVFNDSPFGMVIATAETHRIIAPNPAFCRMFGYSEAEMIGLTGTDLAHPDDQTIIVPTAPEASDTSFATEKRYLTKSGSVLFGRSRVTLLHLAGRSEALVLGTVEDITREKEIEARLLQTQRMEAIGQLTGGIAHDFNNLLGVIIGSVEFLVDGLEDRPLEHELASQILESALNGAELTRRLLAYARRQRLLPSVIDLSECVPQHVALLQRTLGEAITVTLALAPELWLTLADPSQIGDVLLNLAINARDAMPQGGTLSIRTENVVLDADYCAGHAEVTPGQYVALSVSDTGTGMPAAVLARAMEPFFTTKPPGRGSGLGLSMIYGFAKQSGGHLNLYSEPDAGTTVRLYLPRAAATPAASEAADAAAPLPGGSEAILVVDDNNEIRKVTERNLTALGYRVRLAAHGPEALAILHGGERFDLLFTDVVMPEGLSGYRLAEAAKQLQPGLRVLFTTGFARIGDSEADAGAGNVLRKPYRRQELAAQIRAVLDAG